ncbi:hypothetical protein U9M48_038073 [Paspalum notatum var. saurae]|uniref:Reverse transcriptase zinc-binding domain-containing protein n=1 Tax=Paspalum notatum var. saurae TaxID=547442 RepID=A0AAQ3X9Z5_PASNO
MLMFSFFEAPKGVIKKLDYYRSKFFWQSDEHKKKYRLAKWSSLMLPKCFGGIGILDLELQNKCLLSKWLYKFLNENGAWQELIKKKYLHQKSITQVSKKPEDSQFWSGLMGVEEPVPFFWLFQNPKWSIIVRKTHVTVASVLNSNDKFRWDLNKRGAFSVQSLYNVLIQDRSLLRNSKLWKIIWSKENGKVTLSVSSVIQRKQSNIFFFIVMWQDLFGIPFSLLVLYVGLFGYGGMIWFSIEDILTYLHRATYWIRCWSALCKEEERGKLKVGCRHLKSVVLKLFFNFGWQRSYRIEA